MKPHVDIGEGTALEVLLGAAAVADEDWRDIFAMGPATFGKALAAGGHAFVQRLADIGRFGWINLISLLVRSSQPWDLHRLITAVQGCAPAELHYIAIGGLRRQLLQAVPEQTIHAALVGDPIAQEQLHAAFASDELVLNATPWLAGSSSADVHHTILDVLVTWREQMLLPSDEAELSMVLHEHAVAARDQLAKTGDRLFLASTIGGLHYSPAGLDHVLTIASPQVSPIVVVVDGHDQDIIVHPPIGEAARDPDATTRLLELSRALGDKTRMRILTTLRQGEMTAVELTRALGAPRTTLLHHLALMRSAGLIHVTVTPGDSTVYRIRPEAFRELSRAAAAFLSTR
jgi:DNA-binding transcriptional ArsR family regulator